MSPRTMHSQNYVLTLKHRGARRKIAQVQWENGPNGIGYFVHLAYFAHETGLLGLYRICGAASTTMQQDLLEGGKTTRHRAKFAHHADGEAQFSGTGKIYTVVRHHTRALKDYVGHAFTISFWNLREFEE